MSYSRFSAGAVGRVSTQLRDDQLVVQILGEVDLSNSGVIGHELAQLRFQPGSRVVVDLTGTTYLDSSGVGQLFDLVTRLRGSVSLALLAPESCPAGRVLRHVGIDQLVPVCESFEETRNSAN